jgi:solute carrier family 25 iron transporter 28/37
MEEELLDWEDNTQNLPFYKHMIAGSLAGVAEHAVSFPFDTLRTFAQAESTQVSTLSGSISLLRKMGFLETWKGVTTVFYGCIPAHALYFSVYELSRKYFKIESNSSWYFFSTSITGVFATIVHDSIMTPMDGII